MATMSDLKACPFCGAAPHLYRIASRSVGGTMVFVQCQTCGARSQEFVCDIDDDVEPSALRAAASWQTRPEEDRLRSALQAAEARVEDARTELMNAAVSVGVHESVAKLNADLAAQLKEQLQAAERERDEARAEVENQRRVNVNAVSSAIAERDAARLEATRFARELVEARNSLPVWIDTLDQVTVDNMQAKIRKLTEERDEARAAIARAELACKDLLEKLDRLDKRVETVVAERDEARAYAGGLAEQVVELTGKLVVAEVEVGRLREAHEHDRKWIDHVRKQCGVTGDGSIIQLVQGLRAAIESIRIASDGFERGEVIGESSVALKQQLGWINARARQALEPKEVAGG